MIAYKLFKQRKDGTLGPLFINASLIVPVGKWMKAEDHPTKGYAHRPGWHCTHAPSAPHLAKNPKGGCKRVWCKVEIGGKITRYERPAIQGGTWFLANRLRVLEVMG